MFVLTIKYRLNPTAAQETTLHGMLATAHDVYNSMVNWRKYAYEVQGTSPSCVDQQKALPLWKKEHPELREVNAQVLQEVVKRVDRAFEAFFRRVKAGETPGYPRLKGKGQYDSLTYPQATAFAVGTDAIRLSKVGCVKHARTQEQKAARRKANKVVSRIHERVRNRRHDFVHQLSRKLVNRYGLVAVEALSVDNMLRRPQPKPDPEREGQFLPNGASTKSGLNKSIADAAWSMFRRVLTYKAANAGRKEVNVIAAYTSQDCSGCGCRVPKTLSERVHVCPCCGLVLDRDVNSAKNVLQSAVGQHSVPARPERSPAALAGGAVTSAAASKQATIQYHGRSHKI